MENRYAIYIVILILGLILTCHLLHYASASTPSYQQNATQRIWSA